MISYCTTSSQVALLRRQLEDDRRFLETRVGGLERELEAARGVAQAGELARVEVQQGLERRIQVGIAIISYPSLLFDCVSCGDADGNILEDKQTSPFHLLNQALTLESSGYREDASALRRQVDALTVSGQETAQALAVATGEGARVAQQLAEARRAQREAATEAQTRLAQAQVRYT